MRINTSNHLCASGRFLHFKQLLLFLWYKGYKKGERNDSTQEQAFELSLEGILEKEMKMFVRETGEQLK